MRIVLSIVIFIALIVIITLGLKRNNGFFNHGYNLGETNYLTPAGAVAPVIHDTDVIKKAEEPKAEGKSEEPQKENAGEKDKSAKGGM